MGYQPEFLERLAARRAALHAELAVLLPAPGSIVWEVGSGHGHFLVSYADKFPDKQCIGVDIVLDRFERSLKKRQRAKLDNCHFVRAEAGEFLRALPATTSLAEIWILFPDPWPKKRHHKNRVLQTDFLESLATRAGQGTPLYFRTDHQEYFQAVEGALAASKTWRLDPQNTWPHEPETVFQARAEAYHSLVAVRTADSATPKETTGSPPPPPVGPR